MERWMKAKQSVSKDTRVVDLEVIKKKLEELGLDNNNRDPKNIVKDLMPTIQALISKGVFIEKIHQILVENNLDKDLAWFTRILRELKKEQKSAENAVRPGINKDSRSAAPSSLGVSGVISRPAKNEDQPEQPEEEVDLNALEIDYLGQTISWKNIYQIFTGVELNNAIDLLDAHDPEEGVMLATVHGKVTRFNLRFKCPDTTEEGRNNYRLGFAALKRKAEAENYGIRYRA